MLRKLFLMAIAGAAGTVARYTMAGWIQRWQGADFPWGTLAVNVLGCFLVGLLWALFETRLVVSAETRTIVLVGFMGAFTTFSAFILETGELLRPAEWTYAAANVSMQVGLGLAAFFMGGAVGRLV